MLHDIDATKDIPSRRPVDGTAFVATRKDPYGFWYVSAEKGTVPVHLSGSYTTYDEAKKSILVYLERVGRSTKGV